MSSVPFAIDPSLSGQALDPIFRELLERSHELVLVFARQGRVLYVNGGCRFYLGREPDQIVGSSLFDLVHPDDLEAFQRGFQHWAAHGATTPWTTECRHRTPAGAVHHLHWTLLTRLEDGEVCGFSAIGHDVTAARLAERALARSEERRRAVFAGMLDAIVTIDGEGTILEVSDSVRGMFGYAPDELVGRNVKLLMPEPYRSEHDGYLANYRETGATWILNRTREFQVLRADGSPIDCELSVSRIDFDPDVGPVFCGSFRDVTDRKRAERKLADSERRFRAIFDQEFQYVGLLEPDGTVLEVNATALERTGVSRADVIGRPFWTTYWWQASDSCDRLKRAIEDAAAGKFVRFEVEILAGDGARRTIDFSVKPLRDPEGRVVLLIPEGRDITDLKAAQRRETSMLRALAAIGESASLLAHEIKNPITAVHLALRAVADKLGEDHRVVLEELVERMRKLERTMRRTLSFTRPSDLRLEVCEPGRLLASVADLMRPEADRGGHTIELRVAEDTPALTGDRGLLEELLANLVRNSLDALDRPGRIELRAFPAEGEVALVVEDDGPGIPAGQVEEVFRPFVTTKSSGTGIGLALCRKIAEEHGGSIELVPGTLGGAAFELRLPASPTASLAPTA